MWATAEQGSASGSAASAGPGASSGMACCLEPSGWPGAGGCCACAERAAPRLGAEVAGEAGGSAGAACFGIAISGETAKLAAGGGTGSACPASAPSRDSGAMQSLHSSHCINVFTLGGWL